MSLALPPDITIGTHSATAPSSPKLAGLHECVDSSSQPPTASSPAGFSLLQSAFANLRIVEEDKFALRVPDLDNYAVAAKKWIGGLEWELQWTRRRGTMRLTLRCVDAWPEGPASPTPSILGERREMMSALFGRNEAGMEMNSTHPPAIVDMWFYERGIYGERLGKATRTEFKVGSKLSQEVYYHRAECGVFLRVMQWVDTCVESSPFTSCTPAGQGSANSIAVILEGGKRRLLLDREQLAGISPSLKEAVNSSATTSNDEGAGELHLPEITYEQFHAFLMACLPDGAVPPTPDNVLAVLELAHRYMVRRLIRECERRLVHAREVPMLQRLAACDRYGMDALRDHFLRNMSKTECRRMVREAIEERQQQQHESGGGTTDKDLSSLSGYLLVQLHKKCHDIGIGDSHGGAKSCTAITALSQHSAKPSMAGPISTTPLPTSISTTALATLAMVGLATKTTIAPAAALSDTASLPSNTLPILQEQDCTSDGEKLLRKDACCASNFEEGGSTSLSSSSSPQRGFSHLLVVEEDELAVHFQHHYGNRSGGGGIGERGVATPHALHHRQQSQPKSVGEAQKSLQTHVTKLIGGLHWKLALQCHAEVCFVQLSCLDTRGWDGERSAASSSCGQGDGMSVSFSPSSSNYTTFVDFAIFHSRESSQEERSEVINRRHCLAKDGVIENVVIRCLEWPSEESICVGAYIRVMCRRQEKMEEGEMLEKLESCRTYSPTSHNCKIRLPGQCFYVLAQHLAALSPYFAAKVAYALSKRKRNDDSDADDGNGSGSGGISSTAELFEITLDKGDELLEPAQFEEFLHAIALASGSRLRPNPDNALSLISLAHRFEVQQLKEDCERHFRFAYHLPLMERLLMATRYDLRGLNAHLISSSLSKSRWLRLLVEEEPERLAQLDSHFLTILLKKFV